ncbi:hypothetical protein QBC39DRAFT_117552 [Podospora conica]|nr:hypothetical protein QBC39DRAFT_117552 [Schizothecium conicum]
MSGLWLSARVIGRGASCVTTPPAFLRNATTAAKPRFQKPASPAGKDTVKAAKKVQDKKIWTPTAAKPQQKEVGILDTPAPASRTKDKTAAPKSVRAQTDATKPQQKKVGSLDTPAPARTDTAQTTATEAPAAPTTLPRAPPIGAWKPTAKPREAAPAVKKPVDVKSPEYKSAARKWVAAIVALPILFVTSYYLFDRLVLGNGPGLMDPAPTPPAAKDKTQTPTGST